ncbi:formylglycine-generating enzyme family protein [Nonlabens xiamenensis]|uniref:formylglycine-generating enzyme family protein n=1 Tax=Nonlabens xiamenensis TaxID=2341043 RepID=UPI000F605026|nr:formylglycine-generating enzyme family protein [Nonlabens xiamenensis]
MIPSAHKDKLSLITLFLTFLVLAGCKDEHTAVEQEDATTTVKAPEGMVWVERTTFLQGGKPNDKYAMGRELPAHEVQVDGFFIDTTEVTNAQFRKFVEATGYKTIAERAVDWEEMKKQLPPDVQKPHDSLLMPGSLIFNKNVDAVVNMQNYAQWWQWKTGADWRHPEGPGSDIVGKDDYPVVHVAYEDANAYCRWANRRLPTEAEWEAAAQGGDRDLIFTWGNDPELLTQRANTWQGVFPTQNLPEDGYTYIAPVGSYPPNDLGIYDLIGNVWEMTSDLLNVEYYRQLESGVIEVNPKGAATAYNPANPYQQEYVIKGGSFLCHESYCASFRISAKMGVTADSGSDHVGFRTVATPEMISE